MADYIINSPLDLAGNEIRNARLQMLAAFPAAFEGRFFYHSVEKSIYFHNGNGFVSLDPRKATGIPLSALDVDPLNRVNHTGQQLAASISDFDAAVRASKLNQMAGPDATVDFNQQKLTGLADATGQTDAVNLRTAMALSTTGNAATATKLATARNFSLTGIVTSNIAAFDGTAAVEFQTQIADGALSIAKTSGLQGVLNSKQDDIGYVPVNKAGDTVLGPLLLTGPFSQPSQAVSVEHLENRIQQSASGIDPKTAADAILIGYTGNLSGLFTTPDNVVLQEGYRVLVVDRTVSSEEGIYTATAGTWTRTADASQDTLKNGALVSIARGTEFKGSQWYLKTPNPIVVGETDQEWVQYSIAQNYGAGDGLEQQGSIFKAKAGDGILVGPAGISVDPARVPRRVEAQIGDGVENNFVIVHNLGTKSITMSLRNNFTNAFEYVGHEAPTVNTIRLTFSNPPEAGKYSVTIIG